MQFWRGFFAAILLIELGAFALVFLQFAPGFVQMTKDFGAGSVPPVFTLVTSRGYAIGCVVGVLVLSAAAFGLPRTPRARIVALGVVAAAVAAVLVFTLYGLYAPIFAVAGNIR